MSNFVDACSGSLFLVTSTSATCSDAGNASSPWSVVGVRTSSLSLDSSDHTIDPLEDDLSEAARFGLEFEEDRRCCVRRKLGWKCDGMAVVCSGDCEGKSGLV